MSRTLKKVDYDHALDLTVRLGECLPSDHLARFMSRRISLLLRSVSDPSARASRQRLSTTLGRFRLWHIALRVTKRGKPEGERNQKDEQTNTAVDEAHIPGLRNCQATK